MLPVNLYWPSSPSSLSLSFSMIQLPTLSIDGQLNRSEHWWFSEKSNIFSQNFWRYIPIKEIPWDILVWARKYRQPYCFQYDIILICYMTSSGSDIISSNMRQSRKYNNPSSFIYQRFFFSITVQLFFLVWLYVAPTLLTLNGTYFSFLGGRWPQVFLRALFQA